MTCWRVARLTEVTSQHLSSSYPRLTSAQATLRTREAVRGIKEEPERKLSEEKQHEWLV